MIFLVIEEKEFTSRKFLVARKIDVLASVFAQNKCGCGINLNQNSKRAKIDSKGTILPCSEPLQFFCKTKFH